MKKPATFLFVLIFTLQLYAQRKEEAVISLTGQAKQYILPDLATINLTIKAENPDESKTLRQVQEITKSVTSKMQHFGFQKDQIRLTNFSLEEKYTYKENEGRTKIGYLSQQTIKIKTPIDSETISRFLVYLSKNKLENTTISFTTELSESLEEKTRLQLIQKALKNAKTKAELMVQTSGLTITGVAKIGYNEDKSGVLYTAPVIKQDEEIRDEDSFEADITSLLSIEEIEVTEAVSVVYQIKDGR